MGKPTLTKWIYPANQITACRYAHRAYASGRPAITITPGSPGVVRIWPDIVMTDSDLEIEIPRALVGRTYQEVAAWVDWLDPVRDRFMLPLDTHGEADRDRRLSNALSFGNHIRSRWSERRDEPRE